MKLKHNLHRQLLIITLIVFALIYVSVIIIIPKALTPIYEKSLYLYLETPLGFIKNDVFDSDIQSNIGYIFIQDNTLVESNNLKSIIDLDADKILDKIDKDHGKFNYHGKTYYYSATSDNNTYKISITNNDYIKEIKADIIASIFPTLAIVLAIILILVAAWSQQLIEKISHLKQKIDNLDNDDYVDKYHYKKEDEFKVLSSAIDDMKLTLKKQEDYKNQMYQNISHDFKTPLTVIKSYVEGIEDGVQDSKEGMKIIKDQVEKLEIKVHSLLYLNKLTYIKDLDDYQDEEIDITNLINAAVDKFKVVRPDVNWIVNIADKKTVFKGSTDMWEAIIDNILNNFTRYAEKCVKVTIKNKKITFYNDGPTIDEKALNDIFSPYKKGIRGQFGLGLSIVNKTLKFLGYDISVKNEKNGISFIIK